MRQALTYYSVRQKYYSGFPSLSDGKSDRKIVFLLNSDGLELNL